MPMHQASEATTPRRRRAAYPWQRRRRRALCISLIPLLLIAAYPVYRLAIRVPVSQRLNALRAAGHPVTFADLIASHEITESDRRSAALCNMAHDYVRACWDEHWGELPFIANSAFWDSIPLDSSMPGDALALTEEALEQYAESIRLFHQALTAPFRVPVGLDKSGNLEISSAIALYLAGILLNLEALTALEDADLETLTLLLEKRSVIACISMGNVLVVPFGTMIENVDGFRRLLPRVLSRAALPDASLQRLNLALDCSSTPAQLRYGLGVLRCALIELYLRGGIAPDRYRRIGMPPHARRHPIERWWRDSGEDGMVYVLGDHIRELRYVLEYFEALMQAADAGYPAGIHLAKEAVAQLQERRRALRKWSRSPLDIYFMPACGLLMYTAHMEASLAVMRTGIAVERFRNARGAPPVQLTDLTPEYLPAIPRDPFDGNPVRYHRLENGYRVYSVGVNLVDDGGDETELPRDLYSFRADNDIVLRVMR